MAYRFEKNANNETDLVIDGFENGIADSPYKGIANMRNLNTSWYPGVAYTAYKRIRVNTAGGNQTFVGVTGSPNYLLMDGALTLNVGDAVTFTNSGGALPTGISAGTTYFVSAINISSIANSFQVSATLGGSAVSITGTGSGTSTVTITIMGKPVQSAQNSSSGTNPYGTIYILDSNGRIWQNTGTAGGLPYFVLLTGNTVDGSLGLGLAFYANYLFVFRGTSIDVCGDGTGTITSALWTNSWFASISLTLTGSPLKGDTTATISGSPWPYATGTYNITFTNETVTGFFINSENGITFKTPLRENETSSINVNLGNSGLIRMAFVANTNILYFCNGRYIGAISTPAGRIFSKGLTGGAGFTNNLNFAALILPATTFSTWLEQQQVNLLVAAQETVYPWDQISTNTGTPLPITENIYRMINVSNTVYVLAGLKGNIYITNGYSISVIKKISDSIAGNVIDPAWTFGTPIAHRQDIYFPVWAQNGQTNASILNGVLSIDEKGALNFENQNSNGLTNASATGDALLVDVNNTVRDSYYSSWYDGTIGGIDYNSTTLYSNNEPVIETDLIPIGTFAQSKTFQSMEFKLDQPMQSGDSITVYARQSLSDTYVQVGTTTTALLSDFYQPVNFQKFQWIQFKITISCNPTATSSSFVRLREIRIR